MSTRTPIEDVFFLGLIFFVAHLALVFGYYYGGKRCLPLPRLFFKKWIYSRAKLLSIVYYIIGYLSFFWLLRINGGYANFTQNIEQFRAYGIAKQGFLVFMATSLPAMAGLSLVISGKISGKQSWLKLVITIIATILPASQLGFRGLFFIPILQILFFYNVRIKRINLMRFFPVLILIFSLFTFYGIYRTSKHLMNDGLDISVVYSYALENPDLFWGGIVRTKGADIFAFLVNSIDSNTDHLMFLPSVVEILTIPIPRGLWDGKPTPLGVQFSELFFNKSGGISPTIIGEGYWHGSYIGVIFIMLVAGVFLRLYQNRLDKSSHHDSVVYILAVIFPNCVLLPETFQGYANSMVLKILFSIPIIFLFVVRFNIRSNKRLPQTTGVSVLPHEKFKG